MRPRMIAEAEKLPGDDTRLLREPRIDKPDREPATPALVAPITIDTVRADLGRAWDELGATITAVTGREPTAREWEGIAATVERIQRGLDSTVRRARVAARRAHLVQR